jgi:hypothetical protein
VNEDGSGRAEAITDQVWKIASLGCILWLNRNIATVATWCRMNASELFNNYFVSLLIDCWDSQHEAHRVFTEK